MSSSDRSDARLPEAFLRPGSSSFTEFLTGHAPHLVPSARQIPAGMTVDSPHGTTIVAVTYTGGVLLAGDRRATMGNLIAQRDVQKVYPADEFSLIGIAGTAGIAVEMVRLFRVELEHYEKLEGAPLSLDGKANRLSAMIRQNLPMAMQGLAVLPLFAGWDQVTGQGRIISYDATGGRYEETSFHSVGSGSVFARGALKKMYRPDFTAERAAMAVVQALYDAADDDSATGGPDLTRKIYPVVMVADATGVDQFDENEIAAMMDRLVEGRLERPDGPAADLP